jgi:hypothetical protein
MRLNKRATIALSICRNFVGFEGIYEQELNERAMSSIPVRGACAPNAGRAIRLSRAWRSVMLDALL